jgi:hypothetical protein
MPFLKMVLDCQFEVKYINDNIIQQTYSNELLKCLHMDNDAISHFHVSTFIDHFHSKHVIGN